MSISFEMVVNLAAFGVMVCGAFLNIKKNRWSFILMLMGNLLFAIAAFTTQQWILVMMFVFNMSTCIWGFIKWSTQITRTVEC